MWNQSTTKRWTIAGEGTETEGEASAVVLDFLVAMEEENGGEEDFAGAEDVSWAEEEAPILSAGDQCEETGLM